MQENSVILHLQRRGLLSLVDFCHVTCAVERNSMKTHEKNYTISCPDLMRIGDDISRILFFDIETTGFSGAWANVYLIGCIYPETEENWHMVQFFADSPDAESDMLQAFHSLLLSRPHLVHFNGDRFDIPFLQKRCEILGIPDIFAGIESCDILKLVRPFKKLLHLPDLKQKSIETFLGIGREDRFSGGELIPVYQKWLKSPSDHLLAPLLLHNEEDLLGMPRLLPILRYPDFLKGPFRFRSEESDGASVTLTWSSATSLPVPVSFDTAPGELTASGCGLALSLPLFSGELRRFYPDYRDYYYLPGEDCAIHKSVGEFIEKSARKKATAKTCYTRASGIYLPEPAEVFPMTLRREYGAKEIFTPYRKGMFSEKDYAERFLQELLKTVR